MHHWLKMQIVHIRSQIQVQLRFRLLKAGNVPILMEAVRFITTLFKLQMLSHFHSMPISNQVTACLR